jgi:hypothetical protein
MTLGDGDLDAMPLQWDVTDAAEAGRFGLCWKLGKVEKTAEVLQSQRLTP